MYISLMHYVTVISGLTDKFKEKDRQYTGSATLSYDTFMSTVIPFLVPYNQLDVMLIIFVILIYLIVSNQFF